MAAGTFTFYDSFRKNACNGVINLNTDTFKISLHTSSYTPSVSSHTQYSNLVGELSTANGYTNGGASMVTSWTQSTNTCTFTFSNVTWNITSSSIVARYGVIRSFTASNGELVGYFLLDSTNADVTVFGGNTLTIAPSGTGLFRLT